MRTETRIAIPVPTREDLEYNQRSWPMYAEAVVEAGGTPVRVELRMSDRELTRIVRECQGILLPGSPADVNPELYGRQRIPACANADPAREAADRVLLEQAYAAGTPVLGICYGMQSLNVWRGGTLCQDLAPVPVNHEAGSGVAVAHAANVVRESRIGELARSAEGVSSGEEVRLMVNSSHHQAVEQVGADLSIVAVSSQDGVVEAFERSPGADGPEFLVGVQWHPERSIAISATSRGLFAGLVKAAAVGKTVATRSR